MTHSIYTGSFASLEIRWMEVIAELQRGDSLFEIGILVGSNILAAYLKRRLAENGRAVGNIRFHTFPDLLTRIANASSSLPEKPPLPRLGASVQPDGGFIVRDVEPGTYDLYLEEIVTQSYVGPYGGANAIEGTRRRGRVAVTVTGQDVAGVTVSY